MDKRMGEISKEELSDFWREQAEIKERQSFVIKAIQLKAVRDTRAMPIDWKRCNIPESYWHQPGIAFLKDFKVIYYLPTRSVRHAESLICDIYCRLCLDNDECIVDFDYDKRSYTLRLEYKGEMKDER